MRNFQVASIAVKFIAKPNMPPAHSYEAWIDHCFDHPVLDERWYYELDLDDFEAPADEMLGYLTQLLLSSNETLARFSDEQVEQGLQYIVSNSNSDHMFLLTDLTLPEPSRIACLRAMEQLFRDVFSNRCVNAPCYGGMKLPALNTLCFMWWDILPLHPKEGTDWLNLESAAYEVLAAILQLESVACQESALHGLGHWAYGNPERVGEIVQRYLDTLPEDAALRPYAEAAAVGNVL